MKEWYNDIDSATLQRIKTYSAFNDAQSKNLMVQTMYEYREKEIQDFKETNHELALESIARQKRIVELEKENAELQDKLKNLASVAEVRLANWQKYEKENVELKESITKFSKNGLDFLHSMKSNRNCIDCESKMSIQLTKAKDHIKKLLDCLKQDTNDPQTNYYVCQYMDKAEQFIKEIEK